MTDTLKLATETMLNPAGLETTDIDQLMGRLLSHDIDYADLYFQYSRQEGWALEDGAVKSGSRSTDQGVGVRAVSGEKTGFAYSDEFLLPVLIQATDAACAIAGSGGAPVPVQWRDGRSTAQYPLWFYPGGWPHYCRGVGPPGAGRLNDGYHLPVDPADVGTRGIFLGGVSWPFRGYGRD